MKTIDADITEIAWSAGIMDGEGCTYLTKVKDPRFPKSKETKKPRISISQSSESGIPNMLTRLQNLYGGYISGPYHNNKRKPIYIWRLHGHERVQYAISSMWNWLTPEKREQAKVVMLVYYSRQRGHRGGISNIIGDV